MSNVQPFDFDGMSVRVVEVGGVVWFSANDVATALGYKNASATIHKHCEFQKSLLELDAAQSENLINQGLTFTSKLIPESDIYRLVMKSRLPAAKNFEQWVMGEVLPAIRKTGGYQTPTSAPAIPNFSDPAAAARAWADEYEQRQKTEQQMLLDKPYANLGKVVASPDNVMTRRDWCNLMKREHGVNVAERKLTQWLIDSAYCYRDQLTNELRAYAHNAHLLTLKAEIINGHPRNLLMVTGTGIKELTNAVLRDFSDDA